jgi:hypothetical protein
MTYTKACSGLDLQTRPRFRPVSLSLSMTGVNNEKNADVINKCVKLVGKLFQPRLIFVTQVEHLSLTPFLASHESTGLG